MQLLLHLFNIDQARCVSMMLNWISLNLFAMRKQGAIDPAEKYLNSLDIYMYIQTCMDD